MKKIIFIIIILVYINNTLSFRSYIPSINDVLVNPPTAPSLYPLQYIDIGTVGSLLLEESSKKFVEAVVPVDLSDAIAVALSEGASGFLGGIAAKSVSLLDNNKENEDNIVTNSVSSGSYFAVRGGLRAVAELVGMSSILVNVIALVLATLISEIIKLRSRDIANQQTRVGDGPTMYELMKARNPTTYDLMKFRSYESENAKKKQPFIFKPKVEPGITKPEKVEKLESGKKKIISKYVPTEIASDVAKWITFDSLVPNTAYVPLDTSFTLGSISGIVAQFIKESKLMKNENVSDLNNSRLQKLDNILIRVAKSALEGGVQFWTYECTRNLFLTNVNDPEKLLTGFKGLLLYNLNSPIDSLF